MYLKAAQIESPSLFYMNTSVILNCQNKTLKYKNGLVAHKTLLRRV